MSRWELGAWQAATREAGAHVARAEGRPAEYTSLLLEAARQFAIVGHGRDSDRCTAKADELSRAARAEVPPQALRRTCSTMLLWMVSRSPASGRCTFPSSASSVARGSPVARSRPPRKRISRSER